MKDTRGCGQLLRRLDPNAVQMTQGLATSHASRDNEGSAENQSEGLDLEGGDVEGQAPFSRG